ncbi:SusC/RagA family TonB-linked outer membrane protein [Fibrella aquatilis]|uniref:SusC/RagA family TonB-linked outer membrane protein n=1 Tax=Fibrella aquatilis TaxID=2817059 RepID=A0A939G7M1_9BACT|nr:SusC/RagA family TonB-linked outer membrane protein [Fibrella aquatilis]MBO0932129.1 SusC/RagA family TonB-linked outer membrane protein [Fibrella aquatilis]
MMRNLLKLWLLLLLSVPALAQSQAVTGKVTSSDDGSAIPGVSVVIKGTTRGTTTDANGAFQVTATDKSQLTFSYVGFKTVTITVGNRSTIDVKLEADASSLNEVVVTALGVVRQQKELGSATEVVKAEKITQARAANLAQALSGKVAGLQINTINNGVDPQTRIVLRGNRSLLGNNQALVVIDGTQVPQEAINYVNPNDVENVSVLKGANAAALYGSEASNGAILITTKKGAAGAPRITFGNTSSIDQIGFMPKFNERFGAGTESYSREYIPFENQSYGPEFDGSIKELGQPLEDGTIAKAAYSNIPNGRRNAFDNGSVIQNDISLTSGDANGSFLISLQDVNTTGITPGDKSRRTGGRFNATRQYGKFSGSFNIDYRIKEVDRTNSNFYNNILNTASNIDLNEYRNWRPLRLDNGQLNPANPNNYFNDYFDSPFFAKDINRENSTSRVLTGNFQLNYEATSWLKFLYRFGVTNQSSDGKNTSAKYGYSAFAKAHIYRAKDLPGSVSDFSNNNQRINQDFFATLQHTLGPIKATLIAGTNLQERRFKQTSNNASALVIPDLYNVSNRVGEPGVAERTAMARLVGVYGDLTLGYKDFLFLHMSGRNDWSSILAPQNRSFFYPGADISFVMTDAIPSLKNGNFLSSAKIRAAATRVGQINLPGDFGAYQLETVFNPGGGFPYGGLPGFTLGNVANNPNIQPEFLDSYEVGTELAFLGDRVTLDMSYYTQRNTNQTVRIDVSPATGYSGALINTGRLDNDGFEIDLKTTPVRLANGFRWDLGINYSRVSTKVVSIVEGLKEINLSDYYNAVNSGLYQIFAVEGQQFPVVKVVGYERERDAAGNIIPGGRVVVDPASGYPLKAAELINLGQTNPPDRLGINSTLRYKGFALSGTAEYRGGNLIAHGLAESMWFTGAAYATTTYGRERFIFPNSVTKNADGTYAANTSIAVKDGGLGAFDSNLRNFGENFVTSGAFWKLRELAISYTVSPALLQKTRFLKSANVGLVGRNLITLLPKENIYTDPEFNNSTSNAVGVNATSITPPLRSYGFTLQLGF